MKNKCSPSTPFTFPGFDEVVKYFVMGITGNYDRFEIRYGEIKFFDFLFTISSKFQIIIIINYIIY